MNTERIKNVLDKAISDKYEVGAAVVAVKDGQELFSCASGFADKKQGIPMTAETICTAFSCSKIATSTAVMQLLERGLISLNSKLEWYIPEFANPVIIRDGKEIPCKRSIEIRDLLNMTSGIPYPGGDSREGIEQTNNLWYRLEQGIINGNEMTTLEFAREAGKCPLMFEPGEEWMYGASADIMGAVIEAVSGMRFGDYLSENILRPLGMNDTGFYVKPEKHDRLSVLYETAGNEPKPFTGHNLCIYDLQRPGKFESGGAGLFTSCRDYSKLGAALSNGGGGILGRKTIELMSENALTQNQRKTFTWDSTVGYGYANFLRVLENRNAASSIASKGAFGWDGWTGTYLLCDPAERMAITVFVQRTGAGTTQLSRDIVNAVYSLI